MRHDEQVTGMERLPSGEPGLMASAIEQLPFTLGLL
jgi:hypothetical protein